MLLVTNCATLTPGEGALTRNSTREPVAPELGHPDQVTGCSPSWELTGHRVNPYDLYFAGAHRTVLADRGWCRLVLLVTRQNCVSSGII